MCVDLIFTNVSGSFETTCVMETGLSDFHLMILIVVRKSFRNLKPTVFKLWVLQTLFK